METRRAFLRVFGAGAAGVVAAGRQPSAPRTAARPYDITEYGARGDATFNNRSAIQRAIDRCTEQGGGTVYVPPGRFLTGTIRLRSHVHLFLDSGATLVGSSDPADYEQRQPGYYDRDAYPVALVLAEGVEHIALTGFGTIHGGGLATDASGQLGPFRPRMLAVEDCRHVTIEGVRLLNSDRWTLHLYHCDHVRVRGISIQAHPNIYNTDGIDVDGSADVLIADCDIAVGDDPIVLKTTDYLGPPRPCRNVTVTNCMLATRTSGFKIGTETPATVENVVFSNSVIQRYEQPPPGEGPPFEPHYPGDVGNLEAGIAIMSMDGGDVRRVAISNIVMTDADAPIFLRLANRGRNQENPTPGRVRDLVIDNVLAMSAEGAFMTSSILGLPGHPVENVVLSNIQIQARGGGAADLAFREVPELPVRSHRPHYFGTLPSYGIYARHASGLTLHNVRILAEELDARPVLVANDVADLQVENLSGYLSADTGALGWMQLRDVQLGAVRMGLESRLRRPWVEVEGANSDGIRLLAVGTTAREAPVSIGPEVPEDAVRVAR